MLNDVVGFGPVGVVGEGEVSTSDCAVACTIPARNTVTVPPPLSGRGV